MSDSIIVTGNPSKLGPSFQLQTMALKPVMTFSNAIMYTFVAVFGTIILAGGRPEFCTSPYMLTSRQWFVLWAFLVAPDDLLSLWYSWVMDSITRHDNLVSLEFIKLINELTSSSGNLLQAASMIQTIHT